MSGWQPVLLRPEEPDSDTAGARPPDRGLRTLAVLAAAVTLALIAVGGLVRATGSGLGCPGWPRCFGRLVPPLEYHAVIEYSHRFTAVVDVVLIGLLAVVAWRRYRAVPRVFWPSVTAFGLVVVQALLGGVVVKGELNAVLVTAHLATAMVLVGALVLATVATFTPASRVVGPVDRLTILARAAAGSVFALLAVGAYVRGEGAGLVFGDWPLMGGRAVPELSSVRPALHFVHRVLALVVGVVLAVLIRRAWGERSRRPAAAWLSAAAGVAFVAQVLVGAANVWSGLAPAAVVAHVALAGLIWSLLVAAAATARVTNMTPPYLVPRVEAVGAAP
jgi:cytochrome c oxidase assembly protein subunit 15